MGPATRNAVNVGRVDCRMQAHAPIPWKGSASVRPNRVPVAPTRRKRKGAWSGERWLHKALARLLDTRLAERRWTLY